MNRRCFDEIAASCTLVPCECECREAEMVDELVREVIEGNVKVERELSLQYVLLGKINIK